MAWLRIVGVQVFTDLAQEKIARSFSAECQYCTSEVEEIRDIEILSGGKRGLDPCSDLRGIGVVNFRCNKKYFDDFSAPRFLERYLDIRKFERTTFHLYCDDNRSVFIHAFQIRCCRLTVSQFRTIDFFETAKVRSHNLEQCSAQCM